MRQLRHFIKRDNSKSREIDEHDTPICPHCGKHFEKSGEHDCDAVLKMWRPGGREFIGDKEI